MAVGLIMKLSKIHVVPLKEIIWRKSDADQIDLMVVYPTVVKNEIGSSASTLAEIRAAVIDTNLCFRNSGVNIQLRLVHCEETSYVPTGNLDLDLERLTEKSDGFRMKSIKLKILTVQISLPSINR